VPYYNQLIKQEYDDDDHDIAWKSLSFTEKQIYKKMRKEVS
jgi:hypothetical protein